MKTLLFLLVLSAIMPSFVFANGGDQRVVDNKYFINLSRAPFTPRVGMKTSFLASFADISNNKLIAEDLIVRVRIAKLGGAGSNKREFLFEKDNIQVKGGVLELPYTFTEAGLHEMFFDFTFASEPQKIHEAPDFLIDVQEQKNLAPIQNTWIISFGTAIVGVMIGLFLNKIKFRKQP